MLVTTIRRRLGRALCCAALTASLTAMLTAPLAAMAAGDGAPRVEASVQPEWDQAKVAVDAGNWAEAIKLYEAIIKRKPDDARVLTQLAYAMRKTGQVEPAIVRYKRALALEPALLTAHEYIGEAYLMKGDLPLAERHLAELNRICSGKCEEYADLKEAVEKYRAGKK
jgi:Flp pilus assembly protein TadD